MIRRLFWVSVGVGVTVYALQKVNRAGAAMSKFAPASVASAVGGLAASLRELTGEFTAAMTHNEQAITEALLRDTPRHASRPAATEWEPEFSADEGDPDEFF